MPYMIRNREGLFSGGGRLAKFKEHGKVWKTLSQLKIHLAMFRTFQGQNNVPEDWEVVEIQIQYVPHAQNARELAQAGSDETSKRMQGYRNKFEKRQADEEKRLLKRLKEKYER